jgi:hypothetical protein
MLTLRPAIKTLQAKLLTNLFGTHLRLRGLEVLQSSLLVGLSHQQQHENCATALKSCETPCTCCVQVLRLQHYFFLNPKPALRYEKSRCETRISIDRKMRAIKAPSLSLFMLAGILVFRKNWLFLRALRRSVIIARLRHHAIMALKWVTRRLALNDSKSARKSAALNRSPMPTESNGVRTRTRAGK